MRFVRFSLFLFSLFCFSAASAFSETQFDEIVELYNQGKFDKAKKVLIEYLSVHPEDRRALYYMGKMEEDAERSIKYFKTLLEKPEKDEKTEETLLSICQYNYSQGLYLTTLDYIKKFKQFFPESFYLPEILWLSGSSYLATAQYQQARDEFEKIIRSHPQSSWSVWAQLGLGDIYFSQETYKEAVEEYKKVLDDYEDSEAVSSALIQISTSFAELGEEDKAILYFNLYKEKYPSGIQVEEDIADKIKPKPKQKEDKGEAEKLAGVEYTIQLGVFAQKDNAQRLIYKLKSQGYKTRLFTKEIDEKKYWVVQVGTFYSLDQAKEFKEKLEKEHGEVYRIVMK